MNNEINLLIKVDQVDINKEIYFLDNNGIFFNNYNNIGLKKLNKLNTEIYINSQLNEYNNYFKPVKEGEYQIKLKFYINLTDCSYMFAGCNNIIIFCFNS